MSSVDDEDTSSIVQEATLSRIRNVVNENKIKLWTPPYYDKDNPEDDAKLLQLASTLAVTLEMDDVEILEGLKKLQRNALEKLVAREKLAKSNEMTIKVKAPKTKLGTFPLTLDGNSNVSVLVAEILEKLGETESNVSLRLISGGNTLVENKTLLEQGVKPGVTVMVLKIKTDNRTWAIVEEQRQYLNTVRSDAEVLCNDKDDRLEIINQTGERMQLPREERNALIMAISLHEKGRAAMRRLEFELGLILLTEARDEYRKCSVELLKPVDNYGNSLYNLCHFLSAPVFFNFFQNQTENF